MHSGGHDANVITRYSDLEYQLSAYEQYPWTKDYPEPLQQIKFIQQKLEELISANYQPTRMSNYDPYRVLREMKEQQELNEKALDFLRGLHLSTVSTTSSLPYATSRLRRAVGDNVR
ncbi:unnamed protein product [Rotaria sp. Silwood1]|nr:unnamed protein product [Rotaria sp. Silwood1]